MTRKPILNRVFLLQMIISFTEFMVTAFFPVLIVNKGYPDGSIAFIILVGTLALIGFKPLLGKISDKLGFERPIMVFLIIACFTIISMTYFNDFIILIILYAIVSASLLTSYTAVNGAASKFSLNSEKGLALGVLGFWVSFGRASSTLLIGPIWESFSIGISLAILSTLIILLIAGYYLLVYRKNPLRNNLMIQE
jgi:MFS family permease